MNVTQLDGSIFLPGVPRPTQEELQNEYDRILAGSITKKLLDAGLITPDEYARITAKNNESFPSIMP